MTTISAKSILSSINTSDQESRVDTLLLRYPRCIHSELMTHRVFSRNAASSRAIPIDKMIQSVIDDPFFPIYWGKNQPGMQAAEELSGIALEQAKELWRNSMLVAVRRAKELAAVGAHKQIVNRILEPYMHITVLVTSTNWSNFLALRDHPAAEPHICVLAKEVRKALDDAEVQLLYPGEWHLPFVGNEDYDPTRHVIGDITSLIKLSVARCASTSYKTVEGFDMTLERAIEIHDKLISSVPLHASPAEHPCYADRNLYNNTFAENRGVRWQRPRLHGNFTGFCQYRKLLPNECL